MEPFDCELLREGLLAQPVNSISALAFVAAAVVLWPQRRDAAGLVGATGLCSLWFHAAPGGAASWAHDISLYAVIAIAAIEVWRLLAARRLPVPAIAMFIVGLGFWSVGRTGSAFCSPESLLQWHAGWHLLAASALVLLFKSSGPAQNE